jgi:hypothetical protein
MASLRPRSDESDPKVVGEQIIDDSYEKSFTKDDGWRLTATED